VRFFSVSLFLVLPAACASGQKAPVRGPDLFRFDFLCFRRALDSEPESAIAVRISVEKEDPVAGRVWWWGLHIERGRIGWGREGAEWTSWHKVWSPRLQREVEVDFNSGAVISRIRGDIGVDYVYTACKNDPDPMARTPCDGIKLVFDTWRADEVTYRDRNGDLQVVRIPRAGGPKQDQLCTLHGGRSPPRTVLSDKERTDRAHMMDASLKGWRTREAEFLLFYAEDRWLSKNPKIRKSAQETYDKLLKEFSNEDVVLRNGKRIRVRAEAKIED
jgi:hypothetical protein